jgi:hypothetical protein
MADKHEYKVHPLAMKMPELSPDDRAVLLGDIREVGLLERITLHEGMILDGRSRYEVCKALQYQFKDTDFVSLPAGVDPLAFVVSKNIARRHLTVEQKRELIKALVAENPNSSSRVIARLARVSPTTVGAVRATVQTGQLNSSPDEKRVGADGKARGKPKGGRKKGTVTAATLRKNIDGFIEEWTGFNENQKTTFVKAYRDELRELLEWVEAQPVEEPEEEVEEAA